MKMQNIKQGVLVNGSLGRVISFEASNEGVGTVEGVPPAATQQNSVTIAMGDSLPSPSMTDVQANQQTVLPTGRYWPRVLFQNGLEHVCSPEDFTVNNPDGSIAARRRQVNQPLAQS